MRTLVLRANQRDSSNLANVAPPKVVFDDFVESGGVRIGLSKHIPGEGLQWDYAMLTVDQVREIEAWCAGFHREHF